MVLRPQLLAQAGGMLCKPIYRRLRSIWPGTASLAWIGASGLGVSGARLAFHGRDGHHRGGAADADPGHRLGWGRHLQESRADPDKRRKRRLCCFLAHQYSRSKRRVRAYPHVRPDFRGCLRGSHCRTHGGGTPQVGIGAAEELFSHDAEVRTALHAVQAPISAINAGYLPTDIGAARRYSVDVFRALARVLNGKLDHSAESRAST
jgi:hypothetical protein